ncbi:hypothetical protein KQX54_012665 [Cotesia glomerata]|uniref:G/T mismatch-specific thymine DNA glycosylase n=1 Tax=Cotesia glomerata TaxID=32391 RepID=A0AAV7J1J7_COTGL|nr:hypothetical protein KQX54_012665 [Cotesia glomerata]
MSKKKNGRFDGTSEEEIMKKSKTLSDYLQPDLDVVFVGINPSLTAAYKGRYYAGPGNHFYKLLHASELVPKFVSFEEDNKLLEYNIGLTNIVDRATRSSADLNAKEIKLGCDIVNEKLKKFKPKLAVFNGKCIYQIFAQQFGKTKFNFGLQNEKIGDTALWVVPSSSARCSNYPRMEDKLFFYQAIKKHVLFLRGKIDDLNLNEFYNMDLSRPVVKKAKSNSDFSKNSTETSNEYPQYFVAEILDGTQNKNQNKFSVKSEAKSSYFESSCVEKKDFEEEITNTGDLKEEIKEEIKEEDSDLESKNFEEEITNSGDLKEEIKKEDSTLVS